MLKIHLNFLFQINKCYLEIKLKRVKRIKIKP